MKRFPSLVLPLLAAFAAGVFSGRFYRCPLAISHPERGLGDEYNPVQAVSSNAITRPSLSLSELRANLRNEVWLRSSLAASTLKELQALFSEVSSEATTIPTLRCASFVLEYIAKLDPTAATDIALASTGTRRGEYLGAVMAGWVSQDSSAMALA